MNRQRRMLGFSMLGILVLGLALPTLGFCSVESSLENVQSKLEFLLPILATLGLGFAGVSFLIGSPNARGHLWLAIIGMVIGLWCDEHHGLYPSDCQLGQRRGGRGCRGPGQPGASPSLPHMRGRLTYGRTNGASLNACEPVS